MDAADSPPAGVAMESDRCEAARELVDGWEDPIDERDEIENQRLRMGCNAAPSVASLADKLYGRGGHLWTEPERDRIFDEPGPDDAHRAVFDLLVDTDRGRSIEITRAMLYADAALRIEAIAKPAHAAEILALGPITAWDEAARAAESMLLGARAREVCRHAAESAKPFVPARGRAAHRAAAKEMEQLEKEFRATRARISLVSCNETEVDELDRAYAACVSARSHALKLPGVARELLSAIRRTRTTWEHYLIEAAPADAANALYWLSSDRVDRQAPPGSTALCRKIRQLLLDTLVAACAIETPGPVISASRAATIVAAAKAIYEREIACAAGRWEISDVWFLWRTAPSGGWASAGWMARGPAPDRTMRLLASFGRRALELKKGAIAVVVDGVVRAYAERWPAAKEKAP